MTLCGNPLSRSLSGVKRTCLIAAHMSAFDPKRTKADAVGLSAMCPNSCRQLGLLDQRVGARDELHKRLYVICINAVNMIF
jgi:hypothetical protein